jgi:DNA-binding transcriptional ArsR family regulator
VRRVAKILPSQEAVERLSEIFSVLGDPTRTKILFSLSREELCVCDLARLLGLSESAASHQLRLLRAMRLVKYRKAGKMAYYSLDDDHIADLIKQGLKHVEE